MTTKVTGRSFFHQKPAPTSKEPKEEQKSWVNVVAQKKIAQTANQPKPESKRQVSILSQTKTAAPTPTLEPEPKKQVTVLEQAKISETAPPASLSNTQTVANYSMPVSFTGRPVKDIEDDDIWSQDDPWFQQLQKLQPILQQVLGRTSTCEYATQDWTLSADDGSSSD